MKNVRKVLLLVLCAVLLVCASVAGTVAYLTSKTGVVKNTFTVGNVQILLDETDTDTSNTVIPNVELSAGGRDHQNKYHLLPGKEYAKDPIVTVKAGSDKCYVFVKVDNQIKGIETAETAKQVAEQMEANDWVQLEVGGVKVEGVWYYAGTKLSADVAASDISLPVFANFTIAGTVDNDTLAAYANKTITIQAYAIQASGFADAATAWAAAPLADWLTANQ